MCDKWHRIMILHRPKAWKGLLRPPQQCTAGKSCIKARRQMVGCHFFCQRLSFFLAKNAVPALNVEQTHTHTHTHTNTHQTPTHTHTTDSHTQKQKSRHPHTHTHTHTHTGPLVNIGWSILDVAHLNVTFTKLYNARTKTTGAPISFPKVCCMNIRAGHLRFI